MVDSFPREIWKVLKLESKSGQKYAVSNFGRIVSFTNSISTGRLLKCGEVKGYKVFRNSQEINEKMVSKGFFLHKLVAEQFLLNKKNENQTYVIHLDYVKSNNHIENLRWASKEEMELHQSNNPIVIQDRKRLREFNRLHTYKLSEAKVKVLKRKLSDPNRKTRIKMLARKFGVSEMQLYRIKTGENWGHVKID
jgi:hypothetical protein